MTLVTSAERLATRALTPLAFASEAAPGVGQALDPRRHLAAAVGWSIVCVSLVAATLVGLWTMREARRAIEQEIGHLHSAQAQRLIDTIDVNLAGRRGWAKAAAALLSSQALTWSETSGQRRALEDLKSSLPEIEWVGLVDARGIVVAASGGQLEGRSVETRPWYTSAFQGAYIGDVHASLLVDGLPPPAVVGGEPRRFVDLAAPLRDRNGDVTHVLGVSLGLSWIEALRRDTALALAERRAAELLLVGADGTVLSGTDATPRGARFDLSGYPLGESHRSEDGYLIGAARSRGVADFPGLGWSVIVREPVTGAFAPATRVSLSIFGAIALGGVLAALAGAFSAGRIMRRLKLVAAAADDLRAGRTEVFDVPAGSDEAARIGRSLSGLVGTLQRANDDLVTLNGELDNRVAARTREVERMGQETRFAAVTRERLRIARDLHDTLAHSMLALLTQIRLARKVAAVRPEALDDELARAEQAAHEGLAQARAAVLEARYSPVRDDGLKAALERVVGKLTERADIAVALHVESEAALLSDQRSETVFRILEEAIRNVERHAMARHLAITVRVLADGEDRHLGAVVEDDGIGFVPGERRSGHFGLVGAEEQAELIGAEFRLASEPGRGTIVQVSALI